MSHDDEIIGVWMAVITAAILGLCVLEFGVG